MTVRKLKQSITKSSQTKFDIIQIDKLISDLSSKNVSEYEFLIGKDVIPDVIGKDLVDKAATTVRFAYSPLGKELKAQTDIAKKQY